MRVLLVLLACAVLSVGRASAQTQGAIPMKEYVNRDYKMAVKFPASWALKPPTRNEVWLVSGAIRGAQATCYVRLSVVPELTRMKPDDYFEANDAANFMRALTMMAPDAKLDRYDFSSLGGRKARRAIYSGTDATGKTGTLMHQTLDGDRILTLACFTAQKDFQLLSNDFEAITTSFRFLK